MTITRTALARTGAAALAVASAATLALPATTADAASRRPAPGAGWTVAVWAPHFGAKGKLYLTDPVGHRRTIASTPKNTWVAAWSGDGARVLLATGETTSTGYSLVSVRTGHARRVHLPDNATVLGFTKPKGLALRVTVPEAHGRVVYERMLRFDLDGHRPAVYPITITGAGTLATYARPVETPDGSRLVLGADRGAVVLGNNGTLQRRLLTTKRYCNASGFWRTGVALVSCNGTLWAAPLSGAKATRVSAAPKGANPFGYDTAWRYSRGTLGLAQNGCGPDSLVRFDSHGNGRRLKITTPVRHAGRPVVIGHGGDRVLMTVSPHAGCGSGRNTLVSWNAVTGRSTALLGPGVNGGTVVSALAFGTT